MDRFIEVKVNGINKLINISQIRDIDSSGRYGVINYSQSDFITTDESYEELTRKISFS